MNHRALGRKTLMIGKAALPVNDCQEVNIKSHIGLRRDRAAWEARVQPIA
jgi:hypothetical protein